MEYYVIKDDLCASTGLAAGSSKAVGFKVQDLTKALNPKPQSPRPLNPKPLNP